LYTLLPEAVVERTSSLSVLASTHHLPPTQPNLPLAGVQYSYSDVLGTSGERQAMNAVA